MIDTRPIPLIIASDTGWRSHTRSVWSDNKPPADEFIKWLTKTWDALTPEQKNTAQIEARPSISGLVMVGLRYQTVMPDPTAIGASQ